MIRTPHFYMFFPLQSDWNVFSVMLAGKVRFPAVFSAETLLSFLLCMMAGIPGMAATKSAQAA